jgi:O-antigen ligase
VIAWLAVFWMSVVLLSFPGMLIDNLQFTSPFEWVLNAAGVHDPFVTALVHPEFSEYDRLYGVPRPSPLFAYTNDWGAAMGILTPVAIWACLSAERRRDRLVLSGVLVLSIVPIVVSVNRGCWISLGVAFGYVLLRRVVVGQLIVLVGSAGAVLFAFGLYLSVPDIHRVIDARFSYANTSTRETLYEASLRLASSSPLFGYGSPQSSAGLADSNDVSIGTHGQLWTILVSQGFVGAVLFLTAAIVIWWGARPRDGGSPDVWLHATGLVLVVQTAFYEILPVPLAVALIALAVSGVNRLRSLAGDLSPASPRQEGRLP